ncbi:hypothetical protein [Capnocytophaga sputigena]|uniref:hypothetical protein n=1 Tax=Capnocytophaga sputigena TaxID=1019 RepID=UPI0028D6B91D|nr:hypothetical protein [Capnocytophaga sputigena]
MAIDGIKIIDSDSGYDIYNNIIGRCPKSLKIAFASVHFAKVLIACRATTFAKVLIARRATTFGKVDYSDNQLLLECVV